jgi:hypothetical protein
MRADYHDLVIVHFPAFGTIRGKLEVSAPNPLLVGLGGASVWRSTRHLCMLRAGQAEVPSSPPTACQIVLQQFQHYLRQERGLSEATIMRQTPVVSRKRASRGVSSGRHPRLSSDFRQARV